MRWQLPAACVRQNGKRQSCESLDRSVVMQCAQNGSAWGRSREGSHYTVSRWSDRISRNHIENLYYLQSTKRESCNAGVHRLQCGNAKLINSGYPSRAIVMHGRVRSAKPIGSGQAMTERVRPGPPPRSRHAYSPRGDCRALLTSYPFPPGVLHATPSPDGIARVPPPGHD